MNERGLNANMLWLVNSKYPEFKPNGETKELSVLLWEQYVLDNFATVAEAVEQFSKEEFTVRYRFYPWNNKYTTIHLSISDASGDNAIIEYIDGKITINHDPSYVVMTNDPTFKEQQAINAYWKDISGKIFISGTNRATDRFVCASYYIDVIPQTDDIRVSTAGVLSVVRNCSVPYGISTGGYPNLSTTRCRIVADQKNSICYFEDAFSSNSVWVDLSKVGFRSLLKQKNLPSYINIRYMLEKLLENL